MLSLLKYKTGKLFVASLIAFCVLIGDNIAHADTIEDEKIPILLAYKEEVSKEPIISDVLQEKMRDYSTSDEPEIATNPDSLDITEDKTHWVNIILAIIQIAGIGLTTYKDVKISKAKDLEEENKELKKKVVSLDRELDNHTNKTIDELKAQIKELKSGK